MPFRDLKSLDKKPPISSASQIPSFLTLHILCQSKDPSPLCLRTPVASARGTQISSRRVTSPLDVEPTLCPNFSESPGGDPQNPSWRNIPSAALEQSPDFSLTLVQQLGLSRSPQESLRHPQTHPSQCHPSEGLNYRGTTETKSSSH